MAVIIIVSWLYRPNVSRKLVSSLSPLSIFPRSIIDGYLNNTLRFRMAS